MPGAPSETDLLRADAVVVGSGAGGAPVAARLAEAGREVVLLESGSRLLSTDLTGNEAELLPRLMAPTLAPDSGMEIYAGQCVGGSTLVNDALCWRTPPEILAAWRRDHALAGLSDAAIAPFVDRVWQDIHATPTDRAHLNRNAHRLELGAQRLGWASEAMPRNVRECTNLGLCNVGCPTGAKQSTLMTYVPRAEQAGARLLADTRADRVLVNGGAVVGVEATALDPATRQPLRTLRVEAPLVCVAAGVLNTAALLLRSGLSGHSGSLGQGLQFHSSVQVTARFPEPVYGYYGPTMSYAVSEFSDVNGRGGPGFMIENVSVSPVLTASALPGFGASHARVMEALPFLGRSVVVLRDRTRGSVEIARSGAARIRYQPVREDLERLRLGIQAIARAYLAADASEVYLPVNHLPPVRSEQDLDALDAWETDTRDLSLLYAVHLFGGACMAGSAKRGFVNEEGRAWEVKGLFVTDASSLPGNTGVNPQVTILANALRIAEGIVT